MEVAASLFRTPQAHHLAELRVDGADQSPVAFSDPCSVGRKRRCLFPPFSPRKRMLLVLPPFSSSAPAPGVVSSGGDRSTRTGGSCGGGGGGGGGGLSFSAVQERVLTLPTAGSSGSGAAFAFLAASPSPKQQPLTPMRSTASSGVGSGFLPPEPSSSSLTPTGSNGIGASAFLASPRPASRSANDGGGFTFFRSPEPERTAFPFLAPPKPVSGSAGSPPSAAAKESSLAGSGVTGDGGRVATPYTFSALQTSASPAQKSRRSTLWSRRLAHVAAEGRTSPQPPRDEQLQITLPPQKITKTVLAPATTGAPSRGATLSASPAKASNQEREARAFSRVGGGEGATTAAAAVAFAGGGVVVSVTCSCGAREEFCFDHRH
uniref:Uncharacterized protein n=1 Tax=Oryza punctata TaxID=4537 RepID=A0A0E0M8R4_ORYPU